MAIADSCQDHLNVTSKPSVLVVDDSAINRKLISRMLEASGCTVTLAISGFEAVEVLTGQHPHDFDIVLMDIEMPGMNGAEASRLVRAHEVSHTDIRRIPIIALTASNQPEQVASYRAAGMDAHISKPIDWQKLVAAIKALALFNAR